MGAFILQRLAILNVTADLVAVRLYSGKIFICLLNPVHHLLKFEELGLEEKPKQLIMKKIKHPKG